MIIKKMVEGNLVILIYEFVKNYKYKFNLFNVYRKEGKNKRFLYTTTLTSHQFNKLMRDNHTIREEDETDVCS